MKYKKIRIKKPNPRPKSPKIVELPSEEYQVVDAVATVFAQPAAKKLKQKYAKMRRKKALKFLKLG